MSCCCCLKSVPFIIRTNYPVFDTAGGLPLVIQGVSFLAGAVVDFQQGGVSIATSPSVVVDSPIQITAVTPALPAGVYDVVVIQGAETSGNSGVGMYEAWNPSLLNLGLLCLPGDYEPSTGAWPSRPSAGNSGAGHDLELQSGAPPGDGGGGVPQWPTAAANGALRTPATVTFPDVTSYAQGTYIIIEKTTVAGIANILLQTINTGMFAAPWNSIDIARNTGADSTGQKYVDVPILLNQWHFHVYTWDSILLRNKVDDSQWASVPMGSMLSPDTGRLSIGKNTARGLTIRTVIASPDVFPDAILEKCRQWASSQGYLS